MNSNDIFYRQGLKFECKKCSNCCRIDPGYVFLSESDLKALCAYLSLESKDFIKKYCITLQEGEYDKISLMEKANFDCVFWDKGCLVYEARPFQCQSYPFWASIVKTKDAWDAEASYCPGIGHGKTHSEQEIREWLSKKAARGNEGK